MPFVLLPGLALHACVAAPVDIEGTLHDAVHIRIDASQQLNRYEERSHTMELVLLQLADSTGFLQTSPSPRAWTNC